MFLITGKKKEHKVAECPKLNMRRLNAHVMQLHFINLTCSGNSRKSAGWAPVACSAGTGRFEMKFIPFQVSRASLLPLLVFSYSQNACFKK